LRFRRCGSGDERIPPALPPPSTLQPSIDDSAAAAPTAPAAGSECPTLALAACSARGSNLAVAVVGPPLFLFGGEENTAEAAEASMGSPRGVPVPCISSKRTSEGEESGNDGEKEEEEEELLLPPPPTPPSFASSPPSPPQATASAARSTACCAGPEGAVRAAERPSWLTAEPASRASGEEVEEDEDEDEDEEDEEASSFSKEESASNLSTTSSTHASALPYPSAEASRVLQRASAASIPARESTAGVSERRERLTPPARPRREQGGRSRGKRSRFFLPVLLLPSTSNPLRGVPQERRHGQVHPDQRRRARRVDRDARAFQTQRI